MTITIVNSHYQPPISAHQQPNQVRQPLIIQNQQYAPVCNYPGCNAKCYYDPVYQHYSNACSITHRNLLANSTQQSSATHVPAVSTMHISSKQSSTTQNKSSGTCQLPGCNNPQWRDPQTGIASPACSMSHLTALQQGWKGQSDAIMGQDICGYPGCHNACFPGSSGCSITHRDYCNAKGLGPKGR